MTTNKARQHSTAQRRGREGRALERWSFLSKPSIQFHNGTESQPNPTNQPNKQANTRATSTLPPPSPPCSSSFVSYYPRQTSKEKNLTSCFTSLHSSNINLPNPLLP
ncbi:hypothetical protein EYC84_001045 [Monilinia fructicola]|uniref:Uncharacterized protein n=1 Tax=Monilinia fructicola TaxID=38448 RepID=A0A5M9JJE6_MONFR|nr:hypothetical protein EYC84_001045 [Monilinia fructicola]